MHLYLIRHGETDWARSRRHTGRTEIPLNSRGRDEASALQPRLHQLAFDHVLTSPRLRARETCELSGLGGRARVEPDLAEWDYGRYEGRSSGDIQTERADWNLFRDGCPEGEMPAQVLSRADALIARIRALGGEIAAYTHGQFACVLAARWIALPVSAAQHLSLGTASISMLSFDPHHPDVPVIALWNERVPLPVRSSDNHDCQRPANGGRP